MRALDTNVLVWLIVRDDPHQVARAEAFVESGAWVSLIVLAEAVWVLQSAYELDRERVATVVGMLLDHDRLTLQDEDVVRRAHETFGASARPDSPTASLSKPPARQGTVPSGRSTGGWHGWREPSGCNPLRIAPATRLPRSGDGQHCAHGLSRARPMRLPGPISHPEPPLVPSLVLALVLPFDRELHVFPPDLAVEPTRHQVTRHGLRILLGVLAVASAGDVRVAVGCIEELDLPSLVVLPGPGCYGAISLHGTASFFHSCARGGG